MTNELFYIKHHENALLGNKAMKLLYVLILLIAVGIPTACHGSVLGPLFDFSGLGQSKARAVTKEVAVKPTVRREIPETEEFSGIRSVHRKRYVSQFDSDEEFHPGTCYPPNAPEVTGAGTYGPGLVVVCEDVEVDSHVLRFVPGTVVYVEAGVSIHVQHPGRIDAEETYIYHYNNDFDSDSDFMFKKRSLPDETNDDAEDGADMPEELEMPYKNADLLRGMPYDEDSFGAIALFGPDTGQATNCGRMVNVMIEGGGSSSAEYTAALYLDNCNKETEITGVTVFNADSDCLETHNVNRMIFREFSGFQCKFEIIDVNDGTIAVFANSRGGLWGDNAIEISGNSTVTLCDTSISYLDNMGDRVMKIEGGVNNVATRGGNIHPSRIDFGNDDDDDDNIVAYTSMCALFNPVLFRTWINSGVLEATDPPSPSPFPYTEY
jgi:hypothetical protein